MENERMLLQARDWQFKSSTRRYISHIKDLDIAPIKSYPPCNSHIFSLPVNFQHNRNLPDMGTIQLKAMSDFLD
jgi:hypothetical protein